MSRTNRSNNPSNISRLLSPRGLSRKPPAFSSSPDLTKSGSSDSLNVDHDYQCLYKSHENIRSCEVIHPSSRTVHPADPSSLYEWSEQFTANKYAVSEGYSRLRILDDPGRNTSSSSTDYSVLNIDAIEMPSKEPVHNEMIPASRRNNYYFTLEVLEDTSTCHSTRGNTANSYTENQHIEEAEGLYFVLDTKEDRVEQSIYSYVELDTNETGPSLSRSRPKSAVMGGTKLPNTSKGREENMYDSLQHGAMKPPRPVRSISQPQPDSQHYGKLSRRTPSPYSSTGSPTSPYKTISPPLLPYHKRDQQRLKSCHINGDSTYSKVRYGNCDSNLVITKTHSAPKPLPTAVSHEYSVILSHDGDTDEYSDDDVPITLPPPTPPPLTPGPTTSSGKSSHNNLVELIITNEGPLLFPRKRSLTADASSLRQFRNQQQHTSLRISSATGNI